MFSSFTVMKRTHALYYAPVRSKTMHSLCSESRQKSYLTLPYVTPLRDSFSVPWNFRARLYYVAASQSRVFAKLLVSNKFLETKSVFFLHYICSTAHLSICAEELFNV